MTLDEIIQKLKADSNWVPGPDASDRVWELYEQALIEIETEQEHANEADVDALFLEEVVSAEVDPDALGIEADEDVVDGFLEEPEEIDEEYDPGELDELGGLDGTDDDEKLPTLDEELGAPTDYSYIADEEAEY